MSKCKRHKSRQPKQLIFINTEGGSVPTQKQIEFVLEEYKTNFLIRQMLTPKSVTLMQRKGLLEL